MSITSHSVLDRARRYARRALLALAVLLGLVLLLLAGAVFSLRFAAVRARVVSSVNGALSGMFQGRVVVHGVGNLGLTGISAADAEVFDPAGHRVLDVHGISARLNLPRLLFAALSQHSQPLTIRLDSVSLRHADVQLIDNGSGAPTLADTFLPKTPSSPSSGPGTIVIIDRATLDHVWAHGILAGSPALDVQLHGVLGTLRNDAQRTTFALQHSALQARGLPVARDVIGEIRGSLDVPAAVGQPLAARAHYQGSAADIPFELDASYLDFKLSAALHANAVPPAAVSKQITGLQLRSPAMLSATAEGKLPDLHGSFALGVGSGKVDGDFELSLRPELSAKAQLVARDLDVSELSPSAPSSRFNARLQAELRVPQAGSMQGNFELSSQPSLLAAQPLPASLLSGSFESDPQTGKTRIQAHAEIAEPGASTSADVTLVQSKTTTAEFRSTTKLLDPPRLRELASVDCARGELTTQGSYRLDDRSLNGQISADLRSIRRGANSVARLKLRAQLAGALPHPNADVQLDVSDAVLGGQHISESQLTARGSLSRLALSAELVTRAPERHVQLNAFLSNDRGVQVEHPNLNLTQGQTHLRLSADAIQVVAGRTRLDGLRLEGAGKADVSLVYGSALESLHAQTYELDLARLWRLIEPNAVLKSGTATVSASYERGAGSPQLRLVARCQDLVVGELQGGTLSADLTLDRGRAEGSANLDLQRLGHMNLSVQELRGVNLSNPELSRMTGKLTGDGQVRLKELLEAVPKEVELPIGRALGVLKYELAIERRQPGPGLPTLHVHVSTNRLQLAGVRDSKTNLTSKEEARAATPLAIKGMDVDVQLSHEDTGPTEVLASVTDQHGKLAALSVRGKLTPPLDNVVGELRQHWREIPLQVRASISNRELQQLPVEVRPVGLSGVLSADFAYDGTLDAPELKLSGKVDKLRQPDKKSPGLDLTWQGDYSGNHGRLSGAALAKEREVARADIDVKTALSAWLNRAQPHSPSLDGSGRLVFDTFPIGLLPAARTGQLEGSLSGKLTLEHLGSDATLDMSLDAQSLKLGNSSLGRIQGELLARGGKGDAKLRIEGNGGITTAEAHSGLEWGARLIPEVRLPADAKLRARELRLAALGPLVSSLFGEIDGQLNGDLNAHFRGGAPELDGHVDLKNGLVQVASVGQRFDQISARLSLQPGKAKLEELSARATSGRLKLTGEARFAGLDLTGADAQLRIAKSDKIALSVAGTELGETWGAVDVKVRPSEAKGGLTLAIDVPELHVHLPDTARQDVQDLEPAKGVRIGTHQREGDFVTLPLQPLTESDPTKNENPNIVTVHLGDQIWLQQGDTTKIQLSGSLKLILGDPLTMDGQINLRGGKLDVSGKQFEVESGVVTFSGEPANPTIVATARWDAQDEEQHRVYADASGTASHLKVSLRSEPPLTQDQVLSLIVTGTADGSLGGNSNGGGTAATAVGAVGGAATQGINKALSSISDLDVSTRVDTSTGSARPELVVQLSPRVSAQITRALGDPAPGQPPDLTFLTLNFRILRSWSLSTLVGDRGESGLDLVWRKRY